MYINHEELCGMLDNLEAMAAETRWWQWVRRYKLKTMYWTVMGILSYIEERSEQNDYKNYDYYEDYDRHSQN